MFVMGFVQNVYLTVKRQIFNVRYFSIVGMIRLLMQGYWFGLYYFFGKGKAPFPLNVTIDVTYKCNRECSFCFLQNAENSFLKRNELTFEQIKTVLDSASEINASVLFTGGEPFCRPDFFDILRYSVSKGIKTGVITNGYALNDELLFRLVEIDPCFIMVSLNCDHSGDPDKNVTNMLKSFCSMRRNTRVIINTVVDLQKDVRQYEKVIKTAAEVNADLVSMDLLRFMDKSEYANYSSFLKVNFSNIFIPSIFIREKVNISFEEAQLFYDRLNSHARIHSVPLLWKPRVKGNDLFNWFSDSKKDNKRKCCLYLWNVARISAFGDLYPCNNILMPLGNIKEQSLPDLWNNEKMREFRRVLKNQTFMPACLRCNKK